MTERTLVLSPHSDDAVLSSFGIIAKKLLPEPIRMLTVFGWSSYSVPRLRSFMDLRTMANSVPRPGELVSSLAKNGGHIGRDPRTILKALFDLKEPYKVTRIRILEDSNFAKRTGLRFSYFNLPDSKLRHGTRILDAGWPIGEERQVFRRLQRGLGDFLARIKPEVVVAPWPYGPRQHVDHRLVNMTAAGLCHESGIRLLYVDDLPYSRRPLETSVDGGGYSYAPQVVRLDESEMKRKYRAMGLYRSQMTPGLYRAVARPPPGPSGLPNTETLWEPVGETGH